MSRTHGHSAIGRIMSMKSSNGTMYVHMCVCVCVCVCVYIYIYIYIYIYMCTHTHTRARASQGFILRPFSLKPLINLRPLILGLMLFGWFISIYLIPFFYGCFIFIYDFLIYIHFFRKKIWRKTRPWSIHTSSISYENFYCFLEALYLE